MQQTFLPMFCFAPGSGRWQREQPAQGPTELRDPIKVLTYNVLFSDMEAASRRAAILDILAEENADVVTLQEVTPNFRLFVKVGAAEITALLPGALLSGLGHCLIPARLVL